MYLLVVVQRQHLVMWLYYQQQQSWWWYRIISCCSVFWFFPVLDFTWAGRFLALEATSSVGGCGGCVPLDMASTQTGNKFPKLLTISIIRKLLSFLSIGHCGGNIGHCGLREPFLWLHETYFPHQSLLFGEILYHLKQAFQFSTARRESTSSCAYHIVWFIWFGLLFLFSMVNNVPPFIDFL